MLNCLLIFLYLIKYTILIGFVTWPPFSTEYRIEENFGGGKLLRIAR